MAQKKWAKVMAILALIWIIVSIFWTGLLVFVQDNNVNNGQELTPEQIQEIQDMVNSQSGATNQTWSTQTGELIEEQDTQTGETIEIN